MNSMQVAQLLNMQGAAPNPERSPEWLEQTARRKAMENAPYATDQDLQDFQLDPRGNMTPNTFQQGSAWKALENLQPNGRTAPNPGRSPQWLEDRAQQKMIEDQTTKELEQQTMQQQQNRWRIHGDTWREQTGQPNGNIFSAPTEEEMSRYKNNQDQFFNTMKHPLSKFREALFPE